jgi:SAM-dependent methyltransferase
MQGSDGIFNQQVRKEGENIGDIGTQTTGQVVLGGIDYGPKPLNLGFEGIQPQPSTIQGGNIGDSDFKPYAFGTSGLELSQTDSGSFSTGPLGGPSLSTVSNYETPIHTSRTFSNSEQTSHPMTSRLPITCTTSMTSTNEPLSTHVRSQVSPKGTQIPGTMSRTPRQIDIEQANQGMSEINISDSQKFAHHSIMPSHLQGLKGFDSPMQDFFMFSESLSKMFPLLLAIEIKLFDTLEEYSNEFVNVKELMTKMKLKTEQRHFFDLLDNLTLHGMLERQGLLEEAHYKLTFNTLKYFCRKSPDNYIHTYELLIKYMHKFLHTQKDFMAGSNMLFWDDLKTEDDIKSQIDYFNKANEKNVDFLLQNIDFTRYHRVLDLRANNGIFAMSLKRQFVQCSITAFDMKANAEFMKEKLKGNNMYESINFLFGNILKDDIPISNIVVIPHLLMEFNCDNRKKILQKVYDKLETDGRLVIVENLIAEARDVLNNALIMSMMFGIQNYQGYAYTCNEYKRLLSEIGFRNFQHIPAKEGVSDIIIVDK